MSQNKYKLPNYVKMMCIGIVRGYEEVSAWYDEKVNDILYSGTMPPDELPKGNVYGYISGTRTEQLVTLEESISVHGMRAVETAMLHVGTDIADEHERKRLRNAVMVSCIEGRNFRFEYTNLPMSRDNFYKRRRKFLYDIAIFMGFVEKL